MSYTTLEQLTKSPTKRTIESGTARFYKGHTFFYAEDIMMVLNQRINGERCQLQLVDVVFEREDAGNNHNIHNVVGLALEEVDDEGNHTKWHDKVAVAWPPYYQPRTSVLFDDNTGPFEGDRFEGSEDYIPGNELHK